MPEEFCAIDGCTRPKFGRGWCQRHYYSWHRHGDPLAARLKAPNGTYGPVCTIDGCDRKHQAKGLCATHRWRLRTHGEAGLESTPPRNRMTKPKMTYPPCRLDGCERPSISGSKGWCTMHHRRVRRTGEPGPVERLTNAPGMGSVTTKGYRTVTSGGKSTKEHRFVMEQHLGRPLIWDETIHEEVHHKNAMKADNRLENLELWVVGQPSGARVSDLIKYFVEFHAAEVRAALGD